MSVAMNVINAIKPRYFLMQVKVLTGGSEAIDLVAMFKTISETLRGKPHYTRCLHKFKVTGETRIVALYEVMNEIGLERTLNALTMMGNIEVTCDPLVMYEEFALRLGVDPLLAVNLFGSLKADKCLWAKFDVEYPGMTTEALLALWREEATVVLTKRQAGVNLDVFKSCGQRQVHLFIDATTEIFDQLTFMMPLMQLNGNNTHIVTKSLQKLDPYLKAIGAKKF